MSKKRTQLTEICIPIGSKKKIKCPGDDCSIKRIKKSTIDHNDDKNYDVCCSAIFIVVENVNVINHSCSQITWHLWVKDDNGIKC